MKVGTKSILFGAHCFFIHPIFVFIAWWKLYGFPWDPRLWVAFFVHDLGYWGKPNMDGPEGEAHPELGAKIMSIFDWCPRPMGEMHSKLGAGTWRFFTLFHSRFYAKKLGYNPSRLCAADKLATCITPRWIYLPMVNLSGEVHEYLRMHREAIIGKGKYKGGACCAGSWEDTESQKEWHRRMCKHMREWAYENK